MLRRIIEFFVSLFCKKNIMNKEILSNVKNNELHEEIFLNKMLILIDNGHGDNTPGKRSPYSANRVKPEIEFYEWKWNREIAIPVVNNLKKLGYNAEILVPEDCDISLSERVKRVNKLCDEVGKDNVILVSIHANACGDGSKWMTGKGWEAYTSIGKTKSDTLGVFFYEAAEEIFPDRKIRYDWSDGDPDKEASFYIIKNTKCPAILTENFFYDNIDDVQFILSEEGREKIIKLHVDSIIEYLNS